jgi:hypothetical protein
MRTRPGNVPEVTVPEVTEPSQTAWSEDGPDDPTRGVSPDVGPPVPGADVPDEGDVSAIAESVAHLAGVLDLPIEDHAERYRAVHAGLQDALSNTDPPGSG